MYLPFIPMGVTYGVDETLLPESNEGTSDAISVPTNFPFGDSNQTQFYVRHNTSKHYGPCNIMSISHRLARMDSYLLALLMTAVITNHSLTSCDTLWLHFGMTLTQMKGMGKSLMKFMSLGSFLSK